MSICEYILSDNTLDHLDNIQNMLQKDSSLSSRSDVVELLLKYIISDVDDVSVDILILIDDYFLEHPSFLHAFYDDVMMSATFYSESLMVDINYLQLLQNWFKGDENRLITCKCCFETIPIKYIERHTMIH